MNRVREGFVHVRNPFNPSRVKGYSLRPEDVDVIVFWSKNPAPLAPYLDELDSMGYHYYFQFTLNDYPSVLEPHPPPLETRLETFRALSRRLRPNTVIWRWDPIVISSVTPPEYHVKHFERVAGALWGYTDRVIVSVMDYYGKVAGRLDKLSEATGVYFRDFGADVNREDLFDLMGRLRAIAFRFGFHISTCSEAIDLNSVGVPHGACIDADLIGRILEADIDVPKDKGQRPECLCAASVDIGAYNTCRHGCAYCYANYGAASVEKNRAKHIEAGPLLIGTYDGEVVLEKHPSRITKWQTGMVEDPDQMA